MTTPSADAKAPSANRPTRLSPAASWALPGATRVIAIKTRARRSRIRFAAAVAPDEVSRPDGRAFEGKDIAVKYHQSHWPLRSRPAGYLGASLSPGRATTARAGSPGTPPVCRCARRGDVPTSQVA